MGAVDPSYPLYPIVNVLASAMLLLVLLTSFVRQSWNLGVTFLCFWLFIENITSAVNAIIWSDNGDVKLYVYCDIVSHLQEITYVVKPMATLIITRRLYLIASLQSVDLPSTAARRRNLLIEWTLGLGIPLLIAGPIYYVHQAFRFEIEEGFGCTNSVEPSILEVLTIELWTIIPPLISIIFYYPKVARLFYRQNLDISSFRNSNNSVSHANYHLRILALASIDILLTLPASIMGLVLNITSFQAQSFVPFYWGWTYLHTFWDPVSFSYAEIKASGTAPLVQLYFSEWSSTVLAFAIFGLFGLTSEARASYWRIVCTIVGWFGWRPTPRTGDGHPSLGDYDMNAQQGLGMPLSDVEMSLSNRPSFVTAKAPASNEDDGYVPGRRVRRDSDWESIEDVH